MDLFILGQQQVTWRIGLSMPCPPKIADLLKCWKFTTEIVLDLPLDNFQTWGLESSHRDKSGVAPWMTFQVGNTWLDSDWKGLLLLPTHVQHCLRGSAELISTLVGYIRVLLIPCQFVKVNKGSPASFIKIHLLPISRIIKNSMMVQVLRVEDCSVNKCVLLSTVAVIRC